MNFDFPSLRYPKRIQNLNKCIYRNVYLPICYKSETLRDWVIRFFFQHLIFLSSLASITHCVFTRLYHSSYSAWSIIHTFNKNQFIKNSLNYFEKKSLIGSRTILTKRKEDMPVELNSGNKIKVRWCLADGVAKAIKKSEQELHFFLSLDFFYLIYITTTS